MATRALVISGGGSKGAFAVGVLKNLTLHYPSITFDIIVGTSTGSLIAPFASLNRIDLLEQLYTSTTTSQVIAKGNVAARLLSSDSLFDATPLGNLITQQYTDNVCNQVFESRKSVFFVTTCLQTGTAVHFATAARQLTGDNAVVQLTQPAEMRRAIMASACQPVFMQPVEVMKGAMPLRQYADGGVMEYAGVQLAIDAGATEIFAILLQPEKENPVETTFSNAFTILERTIDIFTDQVGYNNIRMPMLYNQALEYITAVQEKMRLAGIPPSDINNYFNITGNNPFAGKQPLNMYVIRPTADLGGGPGGLDFDPAVMKGMLAKGQQRIDDFMASLPTRPNWMA